MRNTFRNLIGFVFALATIAAAQTPAQVGYLYVGTCDSAAQNTRLNEVEVYDSTGQFVTSFHGASQNACTTGMTFDVGDHFHVISAGFGTQSWNVLEFDNLGTLLASPGPFAAPTSVTHDLAGNLYLGNGSIIKVDHSGNRTTYAAAGGAYWIDLSPDQRTMFYTAANGDVKSFDFEAVRNRPGVRGVHRFPIPDPKLTRGRVFSGGVAVIADSWYQAKQALDAHLTDSEPSCLRWSPDGRHVAVGERKGRLTVFELVKLA